MTENQITPEEFVMIWQNAMSMDEVMEKTKMNYSQAYQRFRNYNKKYKIGLKEMPRKKTPRLDVEKLKQIAAEIISESE